MHLARRRRHGMFYVNPAIADEDIKPMSCKALEVMPVKKRWVAVDG